MPNLQLTYERLLRQRVSGEGLKAPVDVVRWMGAVQAQDYPLARWAVGLRTGGCTDAEVEAAFDSGAIVRTHVMRPTWHFLAPEDVRWMQALTAPRVKRASGTQFRSQELDQDVLKRCNAIIVKALRGGKQLMRTELAAALEGAGIPATGLRLTYIVMNAELDAVLCSGARRGKQFTYALLEERAPQQESLTRDEALALLTERFFTSHGPATAKDFAWWSGLTSADVKHGLEMVKDKLIQEEMDGMSYWMSPAAPLPRLPRAALHLLPNYDEYLSGYTDRSAIMDSKYLPELDSRHNPLFNHPIISLGRIAGTWKRVLAAGSLALEASLFAVPTKVEIRNLGLAAKRLAAFYALNVVDFNYVSRES